MKSQSMRPFLRALFRRKPYDQAQAAQFSTHPPLRAMSSGTSAILYAASVAVPNSSSESPTDAITTGKAHHVKKGEGFDNPWDSWTPFSGPEMGKGFLKRKWEGKTHTPDTTPPTVPVTKPSFLPTRDTPKLRATWLGHACFYVEFPGGLRVLFDPVFEDRCSPFSWLGPKRYTPPCCQIKDLPFIDIVIISHNHYDHLSHPTTQLIKKLHPNVHWFVPLGNKKWFHDSGITNVTEMDWWDEMDLTLSQSSPSEKSPIPSISTTDSTPQPSSDQITARISCLPSQHMSARTPFDRAKTLWASWSITSGPSKTSLYFAGDTGYRSIPKPDCLPPASDPANAPIHLAETDPNYDDYNIPSLRDLPVCPAFAQIGQHRGPFDLGLIPIGAYSPRWMMSPVHANPQDAVRIFKDTKCKRAIGMHWGTWVLTEEDVLEPKRKLVQALKEVGLSSEVEEEGVERWGEKVLFGVTGIGESRTFDTEGDN